MPAVTDRQGLVIRLQVERPCVLLCRNYKGMNNRSVVMHPRSEPAQVVVPIPDEWMKPTVFTSYPLEGSAAVLYCHSNTWCMHVMHLGGAGLGQGGHTLPISWAMAFLDIVTLPASIRIIGIHCDTSSPQKYECEFGCFVL